MPAVARELGGLGSYGWAFSAFMLASVVGTVAAGGTPTRQGRCAPTSPRSPRSRRQRARAVAGRGPLLAGRGARGPRRSGALGVVTYASASRAYPPEMYGRMLALMSSAWVLPSLAGPARRRGRSPRRDAGAGCSCSCCRSCRSRSCSRCRGCARSRRPSRRRPARRLPRRSRRRRRRRAVPRRAGARAPLPLRAARRRRARRRRCPRCARCCRPGRCAPRAGCRRGSSCAGCSPSRSSAATRSCRSR